MADTDADAVTTADMPWSLFVEQLLERLGPMILPGELERLVAMQQRAEKADQTAAFLGRLRCPAFGLPIRDVAGRCVCMLCQAYRILEGQP